MGQPKIAPFVATLAADLDRIGEEIAAVLAQSTIRNTDPNRGSGGGAVFIGFASWGWGTDTDERIARRTAVLADYSAWFERFMLLHRSALPEVVARIKDADDLLRGWLAREGSDYSVPSSLERAGAIAAKHLAKLRDLIQLGSHHGVDGLILVPDTNALLRNPEFGSYSAVLGDSFEMVLMPSVLAELDDLKDRGRTPEVRAAAESVVRRIKGLRNRGSVLKGVPLAGPSRFRMEHREPDVGAILSWLDPATPDDRTLAACLDLQGRNGRATVVLVTADVNLQNKAEAAGLPHAEPAPKP
jgi:hypothetical protein